MKVFEDNVTRIKNELGNFIKENNNIKGENNDKLVNIIKLFN